MGFREALNVNEDNISVNPTRSVELLGRPYNSPGLYKLTESVENVFVASYQMCIKSFEIVDDYFRDISLSYLR